MTTFLACCIALALVGSALMSGVFFAFSSFVMAALAERPPQEGISAMQSINVRVINRSFLGAFIGTAALSVAIVIMTLSAPAATGNNYALAGALVYLTGTFAVTLAANVPLNDRLATLSPAAAGAEANWHHYLRRWTQWNHGRTAAALVAMVLFTASLSSASL